MHISLNVSRLICLKKLHLSAILDLHDQSLVSWNLSESPNYAQVVDMLEKEFCKNS